MCGLACGDLCAALVQLSSWLFLVLVIPLTCLYEVWCVEVVLSHCCRMTFCLLPRCPISSIVWRLFTDFVKLASLLSLFREHVPFLVIFACSREPVPFVRLYVHACIFWLAGFQLCSTFDLYNYLHFIQKKKLWQIYVVNLRENENIQLNRT